MEDVPLFGYIAEFGTADDITAFLSRKPCSCYGKPLCPKCSRLEGDVVTEYKKLEARGENQWKAIQRRVGRDEDDLRVSAETLLVRTSHILLLRRISASFFKEHDDGHEARCAILEERIDFLKKLLDDENAFHGY